MHDVKCIRLKKLYLKNPVYKIKNAATDVIQAQVSWFIDITNLILESDIN